MKHANYEAWVAVGIAFGDVLANYIPGLKWRLVTDQTGTYAALQFETKALSIAAPTMLWKRVERGEQFDLAHMAQELKSFVEGDAGESMAMPNPSIERTANGGAHWRAPSASVAPSPAAHVER